MENSRTDGAILFVGCDSGSEKLQERAEQTVVITSTLEDAINRIQQGNVSCVVSEYRLEDKTGLDLLKAIRDVDPELPFLLWTADGSEEIASRAITAGVTEYIVHDGEVNEQSLDRVLNRIKELDHQPEIAARRDQRLFNRLFESCPTGITVVDSGGEIAQVNDRAKEILGVPSDESIDWAFNDPNWQITDWGGEPIPTNELPTRRAQKTGEAIYGEELRVSHPDGKSTWLLVNSVPLPGSNNESGRTSVVNAFEDVTNHRQQEKQLAESERKFRAIFEEAFDAMLIVNDDAEYVDVNPAACELFGQDREELLGRSIDEFAAEGYDFEKAWREFHASDQDRGHFPLVRPDGERRTVEFAATPDILPGRHLSVLRDVTDRRRMEEELNEIFDRVTDAVHELDTEWRFTYLNEQAEELLGRTEEELRGKYVWDEFPDALEKSYRERYERAMETQETIVFEEYSDAADGWLEVRVYPSETGLSIYFRDISERKERERQLELFKRMVETVDDGVYATDGKGDFIFVNDSFVSMSEHSREELLDSYGEIFFGDRFVGTNEKEWHELVGGERDSIAFETDIDGPNDEGRTVHNQFVNLEIDGEMGRVGVTRDITERKKRERKLERYETIIETVDDGVYAVDEDARFRMVNDAFCALTGYGREELLGQPATTIHDEEITPQAERLAAKIADGDSDSATIEFEVEAKTGERIPSECRLRPLSLDDGFGRCGVVRDITERKKFEETLTALYDSAHGLLETETKDEVSEVVIDTVTDILDIPGVVMFLYDEGEDGLYPSAHSVEADLMREDFPRVPADDSSITGHVYTSGESRLFDDITESPYLQTDTTNMRAGIFVPIGTQGVLIVGSKEVGVFDDQTQQLVELLGANAEAAYNRVEHLSQLKERKSQLQASERKFRSLVETAPDPIFVADVETGEIVETNSSACEIRKQSRDEIIGLHQTELHPEEEATRYETLFEKYIEQGGTANQFPDGSPIILTTADGERIPVAISVQTVQLGDRTLVHGIFRDISDQKRYERSLEELNRAARDFLTAETDYEIAQTTVDIASDVLDLSGVAVYFYDEENGVLTPAASPSATEEFLGELPTLSPGDSISWRVYTTQERAVFNDVRSDDDVYNPGTPIRSELIIPFGEHGVFLAGDPKIGAFDDLTLNLAEILTTTAETALNRIDWAQRLQEEEREAQLQAQQLERVNQINEKIRSIIQAIVHAETRPEIEQAICDSLTEIDRFEFAWIGTPDFVASELPPSSWAGRTGGYLESISLDLDSDGDDPSLTAAQQRETTVVSNIADSLQQESWRQDALLEDFRSVISVPILHEEVLYGVLSIYGSQPATFDDRSTTVLTDLGELIGYALNAVEQRSAFRETGVVELTYELPELEDAFIRLFSRLATDLEIRNITPRPDGSYLVSLLTQDVDPNRFKDEARSFAPISEVQSIGDTERGQFELIIAESCLVTDAAEFAPIFHSITVTEQGGRISVAIPQDRDVQAFIAQFREAYPDITLVGRQDTNRDSISLGPSSLLDHLTTRQQEVLKAAYYGGFFDKPRKKTGAEVADSLGISQPAFSKLLRKSERNLLKPLYEPE